MSNKIRFNLPCETSNDYLELFKLVQQGYDVPVFAWNQGCKMHDIAMLRKSRTMISIGCRGVGFNQIFLDECETDEDLLIAFSVMCMESKVLCLDIIHKT